MRHLNAENIMEYMDGQGAAEAKMAVETHLSSCSDCLELKQELEQFMLQLQADSSFEPPAELIQWGVSLFQPMLQPKETVGRKVRKFVASLVFDTFDEPM